MAIVNNIHNKTPQLIPKPTPEDNGKVPTVEGEKYVLKLPTGGGEKPWVTLAHIKVTDSDLIVPVREIGATIDKDINGQPFNVTELKIATKVIKTADGASSGLDLRFNKSKLSLPSPIFTSPSDTTYQNLHLWVCDKHLFNLTQAQAVPDFRGASIMTAQQMPLSNEDYLNGQNSITSINLVGKYPSGIRLAVGSEILILGR